MAQTNVRMSAIPAVPNGSRHDLEAPRPRSARHTEMRTPRDYPTFSARANVRTVAPSFGSQILPKSPRQPSQTKLQSSTASLRKSASARLKQILHLETAAGHPDDESERVPIKNSKSSIALHNIEQLPQIMNSNAMDDV